MVKKLIQSATREESKNTERTNIMADATWTVNSDEFNTAFNGLRMQAKHFGLDTTDGDVHDFILHEAEVISSLFAQARYLQGVIDES